VISEERAANRNAVRPVAENAEIFGAEVSGAEVFDLEPVINPILPPSAALFQPPMDAAF
jgi:hypothetical protein